MREKQGDLECEMKPAEIVHIDDDELHNECACKQDVKSKPLYRRRRRAINNFKKKSGHKKPKPTTATSNARDNDSMNVTTKLKEALEGATEVNRYCKYGVDIFSGERE